LAIDSSQMVDVADETRVLGPWVLLAPLAHGGMGSVYIAAKSDPREPRALCLVKTLKTGLASVSDYRPRFLDESRIAVLLRHPHLCEVSAGGEDDGEFWLAMELIEGVTFKRLVAMLQQREKQLSPSQAVALVVATLRGLHAAHTAMGPDGRPLGVVHRDVSPHNVMVDVHGHVKVIDFGLATSVLKETFTESAVVLGKSGYMAPEQARGEDVTPTVDQYAAAIVLYELLTDERFYGDMQSRQIWSVVGSGTHVPRDWGEVPATLQPVLARALAPRPEGRFASCADFADALVAACPEAADAAVLEGVGAIVRRLKPDELDLIASARLALAAWDENPLSASLQHASSGPTERLDRVDATESVSRRSDSHRSSSATRSGARRHPTVPGPDSGDPPTAETSATAMVRPLEAPRRRVPLVAAAVGLVVVLAVGLAVGLRRAPPPPPPPTVATTPPPAPTPPTTTTTTTTATTITPPTVPTAPTPPTPPTPTTAPAANDAKSRLEKRLAAAAVRAKRARRCDARCVDAAGPMPGSIEKLATWEGLVKACEARCP
jgi:serine/threonine protein kinase